MAELYDPLRSIEEQAVDSMLRTIALYKTAGWTQQQLEDFPMSFWSSTAAAVADMTIKDG